MAPTKLHACLFVAVVAANAGILAAAQGAMPMSISVPKPSFGALGSRTVPLPAAPRQFADPVTASRPAPARPDYSNKPNITMMSETWQKAFAAATNATGATGTWSINDMVSALQGTITKVAEVNQTELVQQEMEAANSSVPFDEFAGNLFCAKGVKLANCSGVNPCHTHKCFAGSMCMVNMCGSCSAQCVSYAEMSAGFNKILGSIGVAGLKADAPTPNLPIVDRLVSGIRGITNAILPPPSCGTNEYADLTARKCKACPAGAVATNGANVCTPCGPGTFADLKSASCKRCSAGYFAAARSNARCSACPVNTYSDRQGAPACSACPEGFGTKSRGNVRCVAVEV